MEPEAIPADFAEKTQRNARVSERFDELTREGKHGFYETLFRIVHEEVARDREARLVWCGCGDAITAAGGGVCGTCAMIRELPAIRSGTAPAQEEK